MAKFDIIAATGCPTGIAHTFMAKENTMFFILLPPYIIHAHLSLSLALP